MQDKELSVPVILNHAQMQIETSGEGWTKTTLADRNTIGTSAIAAQRWSIEPNAAGPEISHGSTDQLLYVIFGGGIVRVNGDTFALEREAILWLEPGDMYQFIAGESGLEILQGYAPGE
jgi:quercetin dioxygenase-like cupin family protein